jgi:glycosyltransferase involved in cell wall biosynthesis
VHEASRRTELDPNVIPFDLHAPLGGSPVKTTIIVPTRNESLNVAALLGRLESVYSAAPLEVLFVDDSDDETPQEIEINAKHTPFPVRLVHREPGERRGGLSGAVLAGLAEARGDWIVVMDGDLQHPPELAERLAAVGRSRELDLVVASRYVESGDADGLSSPARHAVSGLSTMAAKMIFPRRVGRVSDPMSGFFAVRRAAIDPRRMRPTGYKILLEILVRHPRLRMAEAPFHMEDRHGGQSKASVRQGWAFLRHLTRLRGSVFARQVHRSSASSRLVWLLRAFQFGLIGLSGLAVNTGVLWLFNQHPLHLHYTLAAILATEASTSWLFILTESMVYRGEKPGSTLSRGLRFFLLNHVALAARLPVLALLVDVLGLGVLVANAITLVLLFLVRFTIADAAIYGRGDRDTADPAPPREPIKLVIDVAPDRAQRPEENRQVPAPRSSRHLPYRYSLPGLATIGSQVRLPELEYFRAQWLGNDTEIQIRVGAVGDRRPLRRAIVTQLGSPPSIGYREHLGRFGANFRVDLGDPIEVVVSASLGRSPHVVYTNILEALLRFVAVSRGTMLLHAACVEIDGVAVLISARTDTGKTGTVLRLVRERGAKFLSDDMVVLHPDGRVGCFPKPLTISHHTLRAVDSHELSRGEWRKLRLQSRLHSREGRQFALVLAHLNLPIMGVNALTQRVVPPPKYTVDHLLPCEIIPESKATELFVIQRGDHGIGELSAEESMGTLLANTEDAYQFPPFRQLAPSIVIGEDDHLVLREKERRILESAVGRLRTRWVSTPDFTWADLIPELLGADQTNGRLAAGRSA